MAGMSERGQKKEKKHSFARNFFIIDGLFPSCYKTSLLYCAEVTPSSAQEHNINTWPAEGKVQSKMAVH